MSKKNELIKELSQSTIKALFGNIPFIGTALDEVFFELRGRIKQKRINNFIEELSLYICKNNEEKVNFENIKSDEFGDIFESIILTVSKTKSEEKIKRLRTILLNQISEPLDYDITKIYLQILENISDIQIQILKNMKKVVDGYIAPIGEANILLIEIGKLTKPLIWDTKLDNLNKEKREIEISKRWKRIAELEKEASSYSYAYDYKTYDCEEYEFQVLIQNLCNIGLLIDEGSKYQYELFKLTSISTTGFKFLEFVDYKQ